MKRYIRCSESEWYTLKQAYKNYREFKDADKQSGEVRDLTDELEEKGIEYTVYDNKRDSGCTVFYG